MVDGHPTINVDGKRMEEARNGERENSSFAKEKNSRGEFERPQITGWEEGGVGRLDGGFASKVEESCRGLGKRVRGERVNSVVAAITGMVESE